MEIIMATIQQQLALESTSVKRGIERYRRNLEKASEKGRASQAPQNRRLTNDAVEQLANAIQEYQEVCTQKGSKEHFFLFIQDIEPYTAAFITIKTLFDMIGMESTLTATTLAVGSRIEDELKLRKFKDTNDAYYEEIIKDFKRKSTSSYEHQRRVFNHVINTQGVQWTAWEKNTHVKVGCRLIDLAIAATALFEKETYVVRHNKQRTRIAVTPEAQAFIEEHIEYHELLTPETYPTLIQPADWIDPSK